MFAWFLSPVLLDAFRAALDGGTLPSSFYEGQMVLIPKLKGVTATPAVGDYMPMVFFVFVCLFLFFFHFLP